MGPRRFAGTLSSEEHTTAAEKFANKNLTVWIRGWEYGVEVVAWDSGGEDAFEIYLCGGSTPGKSQGRKLLGTLIEGEFIRRL